MAEARACHGQPSLSGSRFRVKRLLGAGGMGEVYLAEDTKLSRWVAIKSIRPELAHREDIRKRIDRECALHGKVGPHPHIVTLFDRIEENGRIHLVMEYAKGETLSEYLARLGDNGTGVPAGTAADIVAQCLDALSRIHALGIVHRDIKPANILLAEDDSGGVCAKLMDFGIARPDEEAGRLTGPGSCGPGTPYYMAPEQIDSKSLGEVSQATDLYAVGCLFYELVCGRPPFTGSVTEALHGHVNRRAPALTLPPDHPITYAFEPIIRRCLMKEPADRYASAQELREAVLAAASTLNANEAKAVGAAPPKTVVPAPQPVSALPRTEAAAAASTTRPSPGRDRSPRSAVLWALVCVPWLVLIAGVGAWGYVHYLSMLEPEPAEVSTAPPAQPPEPARVAAQTPEPNAALMEMAAMKDVPAALANAGAQALQPPDMRVNEYAPDYPLMLASLHCQWDKGSMLYYPSPDEFERLWDKLVRRYPNNTERQLYEAVLTVYGVKQFHPDVTVKQALEELAEYNPRGPGDSVRSTAREIFQNVEQAFWEGVRQAEEARAKKQAEVLRREQAMIEARQKAEEAQMQAYKEAEERRWKSFEMNRAYNILRNAFR